MSRRFDSGYDPSKIRVMPWPDGEACGNGWWRFGWQIATEPPDPSTTVRLPSPPAELGDLTLIATILVRGGGLIDLDVMTKGPHLAWNEIAYLSVVVQAIGLLYHRITIDGQTDHPLLHVAKPDMRDDARE